MSYNPNSRGPQARASKQVENNYVNGNGATLSKGIVVSAKSNGQLEVINVSDPVSVARMIGVMSADLAAAATGGVCSSGRIDNITTSFAVGDAVYVDTTGALTNLKPDYGVGAFVAGDAVIFIGVIVKNEFNPSLKDLQVMLSVIGEL